jgi:hypothetical protein
VVAEEGYKALWMRKESVKPKTVSKLRHGCVVQEGLAQSEVRGEVEGSVETCVDAVASDSAGKGRGDGGVGVEDFADGGEVRVQAVKLRVEVVPKGASDIGKCIDAEAIEARDLSPPDCVLDEVPGDRGVFLIQVREGIGEPSFEDVALVAPGGVGVGEGLELALGYGVVGCCAVEPGRLWRVVDPRV